MTARSAIWAAAAVSVLGLVACKTTQPPAPSSAGEVSAGSPAPSTGSGGTSIPTLVSVNLQNVLNNLSVSLQVNRDNIPVTAKVPMSAGFPLTPFPPRSPTGRRDAPRPPPRRR
jgi:hypothetical protein